MHEADRKPCHARMAEPIAPTVPGLPTTTFPVHAHGGFVAFGSSRRRSAPTQSRRLSIASTNRSVPGRRARWSVESGRRIVGETLCLAKSARTSERSQGTRAAWGVRVRSGPVAGTFGRLVTAARLRPRGPTACPPDHPEYEVRQESLALRGLLARAPGLTAVDQSQR